MSDVFFLSLTICTTNNLIFRNEQESADLNGLLPHLKWMSYKKNYTFLYGKRLIL